MLFIYVAVQLKNKTVLFYGHFDKQPWGEGWDQNKGGDKPVIENNKLRFYFAKKFGVNSGSIIQIDPIVKKANSKESKENSSKNQNRTNSVEILQKRSQKSSSQQNNTMKQQVT